MMKWQSIIGCVGLLSLFLPIPSAFSTEDRAFTESVIVFNTICAKYHDAQCSGRLSFNEAFEKSTGHVLRYYGQASVKQWLQKELFDILNYMKGRCAYYPMQTPVPLKRVWGADILEKFATLMKKNAFIPVGNFTPGHYRIELELEKDVKVTAHFISAKFEMAVEDCFQSSNRRINIPVFVEEQGDYYFRMYPREAAKLVRLSISLEKNEVPHH